VSWASERGVALPLTALALLIVVSLILALNALSASEPIIASNHLLAVQARLAAESGLEAAVVALSNPHALSTGFATTLAAAPFIPIPGTRASYRIAVSIDDGWTTFEKANQRKITVSGIAAASDSVDPDAAANRAVRTLETVIRRDSLASTLLIPAAVLLPAGGSLRGEVDARRDGSVDFESWCTRQGESLPPLAGGAADGGHDVANAGLVWGPGNAIPNEEGVDILHRGSAAPPDFVFANQAFTPSELAALKALAVSTGTFYQASPMIFDGQSPLPAPESVVYVEGDLEIEVYGDHTTWTGWLVAVGPRGPGTGGRITFRCPPGCSPAWQRLTIDGLLYAEDRFEVSTATANRALTVNGAVVTRNLGGAPNRIDPASAADVRINFRCQGDGSTRRGIRDAIAGTADTIGVFDPYGRSGWYPKLGSYREIVGQP
jgi:hypothetical protein